MVNSAAAAVPFSFDDFVRRAVGRALFTSRAAVAIA
jgi:hypothetical protein